MLGTMFAIGSRSKLTRRDLGRFEGDSLFDRIGQNVCRAECLPRKELYEAWEVARRTRRRIRGRRIVDLACGHALAGQLLLLLDDTSPNVLAVDVRLPKSAQPLQRELAQTWPRLLGRVTLEEGRLQELELRADDLVVSVHACGALTDLVLDRAIAAHAAVAILPCCHDAETCDLGSLGGWMDVPSAIDATRALRLRAAGYQTHTQLIPSAITPQNRLLIGVPV